MLTSGDKLVVTKKVASFLDEGDIVKVIDVNEDGIISFAFGENFIYKGMMNTTECEAHFKKVEKQEAPTITQEHIDKIINNSEFEMCTAFDKCTVVTCKLPNGFVIVEYSACVSPENYDENMGIENCLNKIENKIWELEGYRLQDELYRVSAEYICDCDCEDCDECAYDEGEGCDECCDECDEYGCPYHSLFN